MKTILKLVFVLILNIVFFTFLPVTNSIIENFNNKDKGKQRKEIVIAQISKPKPKKAKRQTARNIRKVKSSSGRSMNSSFKFDIAGDMGTTGGGNGAVVASNKMENSDLSSQTVDVDAIAVHQIPPEFPTEAKKLGLGGKVYVKFVVDVNGKVSRFENINAPHPSFTKAIKTAFSQWKFKPAMKNGAPVEQTMELTIDFNLEQ